MPATEWLNKYESVKDKLACNCLLYTSWAVLRNERNILVAEETTSAGRCGFTSAAFSCPAPACP